MKKRLKCKQIELIRSIINPNKIKKGLDNIIRTLKDLCKKKTKFGKNLKFIKKNKFLLKTKRNFL